MSLFKKLFGTKEQLEEKKEAYKPIEAINAPDLPGKSKPYVQNVNHSVKRITPTRQIDKNVFFVVGTQHYNLQEKVNEHIKAYKRKAYQTSRPLREVVEDYGRIYKYGVMRSKRVELVHERDNQYNENAIAVYFRKSKVGYIKNDDLEVVNKLLSEDKPYKAKILGGPFKELDYDKLVEFKDDFKLEIHF